MLHSPLLIPPCNLFWDEVARALSKSELLCDRSGSRQDFSAMRVIVPTLIHGQQLKRALAAHFVGVFIPPRITTLSAWLMQQPPTAVVVSERERLMALYSGLRQQGWLKKLFIARRDTDLLPLAHMLLTLCDELTQAWLPAIASAPDTVEAHWQAALEQLSPLARDLISDEAQLVWSIWKSQFDTQDACATRFAHMMRIAAQADAPLVWITPTEPDACEQAFLNRYAERQPVWVISLDWRAAAIKPVCASAWPEIIDPIAADCVQQAVLCLDNLSLRPAKNLEDEAVHGAQTIIDWIAAGKSTIAIIAQDRVVARRLRALLERARVSIADETGWKLSTTRAAAALAAWFDVVAARAETVVLLDFLKSPFLLANLPDKSDHVMAIELALRNANILGGWDAVAAAVADAAAARKMVLDIAEHAERFVSRRSLSDWCDLTHAMLDAFGMRDALAVDAAGVQVIALLDAIALDCRALVEDFSFAEWRAFLSLQLESTVFLPPNSDNRVMMMPLNGARLRSFDAVLLVGADANHLPSQPMETLFFANAVRRELGLATRESRQRQQLRDFTGLLHFNREVVLSWQSAQGGEPNPVSPWIARLQLALESVGAGGIPAHQVSIAPHSLTSMPPSMPAPVAPRLLPARLSASGYNNFVACPYQFFATRMLGLSSLDELSDMPHKRDYGDWLHRILYLYHSELRDRGVAVAGRDALLREISETVFGEVLAQNAAALGYYARWQKAIPAYLVWANEREAAGWQFVIGEQRFEKVLSWPEGEIRLHGRIDRIDENNDGERAVLDYKTKNAKALSDRLKRGEDHQLAFYGLLCDAPITAAYFVGLEPKYDKTGDAPAPHYAQWQRMLEQQITHNMQAISQGQALPANGIESVCQFCDVRGLCRKGVW